MELNVPLKAALFATGRSQLVIAKRARMTPTRLSLIVRGRVEATDVEKARLAKAIGCAVDQIFPVSEPAADVQP